MITTPTNIQCVEITGGVRVTWDEGESSGLYFEIWVSINNAAFIKAGYVVSGVGEFDDIRERGLLLKYKVIAIIPDRYSNFHRSKYDFEHYIIAPYLDSVGAPLRVLFQRNDNVLACKTGKLLWSSDQGENYSEVDFEFANVVEMAFIFGNNNVLLATNTNRIWLFKNKLRYSEEKFVQNEDGSLFIFHTPVNSEYPGLYFREFQYDAPVFINGQEIKIWGCYNLYWPLYGMQGATPTNVYYSADNGETVKCCYKFGQILRDDGTKFGSLTEGEFVGDASNSNVCDHVHQISFDRFTSKFYMQTGEAGVRASIFEGVYNVDSDSWAWTKIIGGATFGKWARSCGIIFTETKFRIVSDTAKQYPDYSGIWECDKADIADSSKYIRIHNPTETGTEGNNLAPTLAFGDVAICGHMNSNNLSVSVTLDGGETWNERKDLSIIVDNIGYNARQIIFIGYPNNDGFFSVSPFDFLHEPFYNVPSYLLRFK